MIVSAFILAAFATVLAILACGAALAAQKLADRALRASPEALTKLKAHVAELDEAVETALTLGRKARAREARRSHREQADPNLNPDEWKRQTRAKLHGTVHQLNLEK